LYRAGRACAVKARKKEQITWKTAVLKERFTRGKNKKTTEAGSEEKEVGGTLMVPQNINTSGSIKVGRQR